MAGKEDVTVIRREPTPGVYRIVIKAPAGTMTGPHAGAAARIWRKELGFSAAQKTGEGGEPMRNNRVEHWFDYRFTGNGREQS